jgi:hypothetical protein
MNHNLAHGNEERTATNNNAERMLLSACFLRDKV